jgi:hypothetical protein
VLTEKLADTPAVIARVWRGKDRQRRLVVSAEASRDLNKKDLTFTWVLLRGDPARVTITPRNKAGSVAEVVLAYHERRPITPGSALESNRVDIGVFVSNGTYHSVPGFLTFYSLDSENRTHDERGRILEIAYGAGMVHHILTDHAALLDRLSKEEAGRWLKITDSERAALARAAREIGPREEAARSAREKRQESDRARLAAAAEVKKAEEALQKAKKEEKEVPQAEATLAAARQKLKQREDDFRSADQHSTNCANELKRFLDGKWDGLDGSLRGFLEGRLATVSADPGWWNDHIPALEPIYNKADPARKRTVDAARGRLIDDGFAEKADGLRLRFHPLRGGAGPLTDRERTLLSHFQSIVLAELIFPGLVRVEFRPNFVDQRLSVAKNWRDVYRYEETGALAGWTRHEESKTTEFTPEGWRVLKKDDRGRVIQAHTVEYRQEPLPPGRMGLNGNPLRQVEGDEVISFEHEGEKRKVKSREKVEPQGKGAK